MGKQLQDVLFCSNGGKKNLWEFLPFPSFGEQELVAAGGARSSHRPYQDQLHINGLFSIFFFFNGVWTLSLGFIQAGPRALWHLECKSPSHALIITTGRQLGLKYRFFHNKAKLQRHKKKSLAMIHLYQPVALRRLLEAGKGLKPGICSETGEKSGVQVGSTSVEFRIQGWLIPQNSPQQQKRAGNGEISQLCWNLIESAKQRMREVNRKGLFCIFIILWALRAR